jgi:hypothetical protein
MNTYTTYAETLANDIKNNLHFDTKIEDIHEEVLKASYKLARHIGDNRPMSESKQIVNAFSELIDILPSAFIEMSYWKNIDDCLCECEGWENADCAMISTENISLKHRYNGRYETMAEDIGLLIFSCMDKSEIKEDLELDWDGNQTWQYIHKK